MGVNFFNQDEGCVNKPICFLQIDEFAGAALGTGFAKDDYNHQLSRGRPVCCICTESAAKFPGLAALPRLKPRLSAAIPRRPFCAWPFLQRDLQRVAAVGSLFICTLPFPIRLGARSGGIPLHHVTTHPYHTIVAKLSALFQQRLPGEVKPARSARGANRFGGKVRRVLCAKGEVMRIIAIGALLSLYAVTAQAAGPSCKGTAAEKKLAGAALTSFMTKCQKDAQASCDTAAQEKKLNGAAKTSFTKKCVKDATGA